jgi:DNA-binding NarL/FixJ family response regulator
MNAQASIRFAPDAQARAPRMALDGDASAPPVRRVLILKADLLTAESIEQVVSKLWPRARCRIAQRVRSARAALRTEAVDLLLTGLGMLDGDVCSLVKAAARTPRRARRIVIVTGRRDPRFLALLKELPVDGAYDTQTDGLRLLPAALRKIERGARYVSRRFVMLSKLQEESEDSIFRLLTDAELHALFVFGSGCDAKQTARRLKITEKSARSLRDVLHRKLGVHTVGELTQVAQRAGLVWVTDRGVECLDERGLVDRHKIARRRKRRGGDACKFVTLRHRRAVVTA